jgi:hypothetical protein
MTAGLVDLVLAHVDAEARTLQASQDLGSLRRLKDLAADLSRAGAPGQAESALLRLVSALEGSTAGSTSRGTYELGWLYHDVATTASRQGESQKARDYIAKARRSWDSHGRANGHGAPSPLLDAKALETPSLRVGAREPSPDDVEIQLAGLLERRTDLPAELGDRARDIRQKLEARRDAEATRDGLRLRARWRRTPLPALQRRHELYEKLASLDKKGTLEPSPTGPHSTAVTWSWTPEAAAIRAEADALLAPPSPDVPETSEIDDRAEMLLADAAPLLAAWLERMRLEGGDWNFMNVSAPSGPWVGAAACRGALRVDVETNDGAPLERPLEPGGDRQLKALGYTYSGEVRAYQREYELSADSSTLADLLLSTLLTGYGVAEATPLEIALHLGGAG